MPVVRVRTGGGGGRRPSGGGGALRLTDARDALLRPAIEAAVTVARAGDDAEPVRPPPVALRPFLHFTKLPPRALVAARRALDVDADFRARVADEVTEADIGRAGWLFLTRPDGWEGEMAALAEEAEEAKGSVAERRAVAEARRRQAAAEALARKAEDAAAAARADASRSAAALADERRSRRTAARDSAELARRLAEVTAELEQARAESAMARAEKEEVRRRLTELETTLEAGTASAAPAPTPAGHPSRAPEPPVPAKVAGALAAAAEAARQLAESLLSASAAVDAVAVRPDAASARPVPTGPEQRSGGQSPSEPGRRPASGAPSAPATTARPGDRGRQPPRRARSPLPPAVLDDSPEAAEHLLRLPGVVVLVDGYNVSNEGWPGRPIAEQRRWLVDALTGLTARTGADVRVVFDGSEVDGPGSVGTAPRAVRVSFSPPDVEADDLILDQVADLPLGRPLVVASSDRRVQKGAARQGANVVSSRQLLAVLR